MNRDKIRGLIIGGGVGDAWGMPVETWTPEKIMEVHPDGLDGYKAPIGHKWFTDDPNSQEENKTYMAPGFTTDDTQLTRATVKGLISGAGFDMDAIAKFHVAAMRTSIAGWGKTTVEAIRRLANNVHWSESGKTANKQRGTGNGLPMKCGPLGAFRLSSKGSLLGDEYYQQLVNFSAMTHYTQMSAQACVVHAESVRYLLYEDPNSFEVDDWLDFVCNHIWNETFEKVLCDYRHLNHLEDNLEAEFIKLWTAFENGDLEKWDRDDLIEQFGGGSCYVLHSLPFTYAHFYKYWKRGMGLGYELVHAGGDTDTNAKIGMEMLGALHGMDLFKTDENKWCIEGLHQYDDLMELSDEFCDTFGIA